MSGYMKWEDIKHKKDALSLETAPYQVLGLAGQQGAGKDYTHQWLYSALPNRRVMRMGWADGVRREVTEEVLAAFPNLELGDMTGAGIWAKPYTQGQRWLLQQWGTEFRRAQDPDYWVKYGMEWIESQAQPGDLWCITDVRFANEAKVIEDLPHGTTALVTAPVDVRAARNGISVAELKASSGHASEVIDFDPVHTIENGHSDGELHIGEALGSWLGMGQA